MNNAKIEKFYAEFLSDKKVQKDLEKDIKNVRNIYDLKKIINEKIMPKIKEKGLNISEKELLDYEKESLKSLTEKDLVNINGGLSLNSVFLGGGLLSMIFLGVGSINSQTASATVTGEQIKTSIQEMIETSNISEENLSTNDSLEIHEEIEENTEEDAEENVQREEVDNTENETIPGVTLEAAQQATQNQIEGNKRSTQAEQKTDNQYIMEALNLADPYILQVSGTVERFRFLDGNKTVVNFGDIGGDGVPMWDFKKDSGEGSANLMTSLFPSSAGVLSDGGGYGGMNPLSAINPTPELIAHILNFLHDYRNDTKENQNEKRGSIDEILTSLNEKNLKNIEKRKEKFNDFNNPNNITTSENLTEDCLTKKGVIKALRAIDTEISRKYKGNLDLEKAKELWEKYKEAVENPFLNIEQQFEKYKLTQTSKALDDASKAKYYKTIAYILKNVMYLIENQEEDKSDVERILPKYTPERMIMAYFIHHFNDDQVEPFYDEVKKIIKTDKDQDLQSITENLSNKLEILKRINLQEDCPYRAQLTANGSAKKLEQVGDGKVKFTSTFADCADTVARHIINLLSYEKASGWSSILGTLDETQKQNFAEKSSEIFRNMRQGQAFIPDSLQDRFKTFIYYQAQKGADDSSEEIRSLWNYVISNMSKSSEEAAYEIKYVRDNNELETGFLNCVKLIYNLVNSLGQNSEKLENAKKEIDELNEIIKNKNKDQLKEQAKKALESTFGILSSGCEIEFEDDLEIDNNDFYRTITVKKSNGISFPIIQSQGHAKIYFSPMRIPSLANPTYIDFVKEDPIAQLLAKDLKVEVEASKMCQFNKLFGGPEILERDTQYIKNVIALKFLRDLQGEENNFYRIREKLSKELLKSNIKARINIKENKKEEQSLPLFIFYKFICKFISKRLPMVQFQKEEIIDLFKSNSRYLENINGVDYAYYYKTDGSITICPIITQRENKLTIPSEIKINNENKKVSGVWGISYLAPDEFDAIDIVFSENIETLEIYNKTFYAMKIKNIVFPSHLKSLKIARSGINSSSIATLDLSSCADLESLDIGEHAFHLCKQLKEVKLPQNLKSLKIGGWAFYGTSLKTFDLSTCTNLESLYIEERAFNLCQQLKGVKLSQSLKSLKIGKFAFLKSSIKTFDLSTCTNLESLDIEDSAFESCRQLKVLFPKSLK